MATKSKKSRPFAAWFCFFVGLNLLICLAVLGIAAADEFMENRRDIRIALSGDIEDSYDFRHDLADRMETLIRYITYDGKDDLALKSFKMSIDLFNREDLNLLYWAKNTQTGSVLTNMTGDPEFGDDGTYILPDGYDYYLHFKEGFLKGAKNGKPFDVYGNNSGYYGILPREYFNKDLIPPEQLRANVLLAIKKNITENPYGISDLYVIKQRYQSILGFAIGIGLLFLASVILFVSSFIKRDSKKEFDRRLASLSGWFWFDVKLLATLAILIIARAAFNRGSKAIFLGFGVIDGFITPRGMVAAVFCFWWFYLMVVDMIYNRRGFYANNSVAWIIRRYRSFEQRKPFQKALMMRACSILTAEAVLVVSSVLLFLNFRWRTRGISILLMLACIFLGLYFIYRYLKRYSMTLGEMGQIIDQIERMKNGDFSGELTIGDDSDLINAARNLNLIREGIIKATDERVKSERMKMELITNVSHDLKTPLTSIISYVDLISSEEDLSPTVRDYTAVLAQKADRLKSLIQDIFDLSKANSGAIDLQMDRLDLTKLIRQTLADMDEEISASSLILKVQLPDDPVFITGDGKKLYRVFQNLITNVLKYSLEGSRVYLDVYTDQQRVVVSIKNISNYEMNFREDEIMERFVRGDRSRSTEGSGLGLAIAKSYVEAMGGSFEIKVDGDLFKALLALDMDAALAEAIE